ncbi:hypothetical protein SOVF_195960 [Spinacia oleracea]|uniref:F-box protein CPR1-like n=1 Tax=Spinacia oleracea TaxID=3562 RepID=A0A9R0I5G8_SPIOL|nr:F-box protein CPR1-like [Spinacia oleracea]KNA04838.1 hypothetical protein SOVF_195960 [Spinacia oleracea]
MSSIPVDVITDILLRLPAKSLLRFKSVCKLWYHIIEGTDFIKHHFQQSNNLHLVYRSPVLYMSDFDSFDNTIELDYPFKNLSGGVYVAGSCHGLLCFAMFSDPFTVFLYNPTTQKHKTLPFLPRRPIFGRGNLGFGYDHVSEDYKCVWIFQVKSVDEMGSFNSQVMVYSLRADSWRRGAQDVPYYFDCHSGNNVDFDGILHWSIDDNRVPLPIVTFNLSDESFSSVPLPNFQTEMFTGAHTGVLDDCLCVMLNYFEHYDVWIMKEYGRPASWTKLFRFPKQEMMEECSPLYFSMIKKQFFVTFNFRHVASLDLETSEITKVKLPGFNRVICAHVCPENLFKFKDAEDVLVGTQQQRKKNSKRQRLMRRTERLLQHHDSVYRSIFGMQRHNGADPNVGS